MKTSCRYNDNNIKLFTRCRKSTVRPPSHLSAHTKRTPPQQCPPGCHLSLPLCLCTIFDTISIACGFGENKEVKGNKTPVKMYVGTRF